MRKYIQLSIPEPCHEDWDKMTIVDKGKFCGACQKNVIDFTTMSDEQLVAFFRKATVDSTCGRFMGEQLDRNIEIPTKRIPWVKYFFQLALPAFLFTAKAKAQGKIKINQTIAAGTSRDELRGETIVFPVARIITGQVTDENGNGIPFANVQASNKLTGTVTDSIGKFSLEISTDKNFKLEISSIGYELIILEENFFKQLEPDKEVNIRLKHAVIDLDEVIIKSNAHYRLGGFAGGLVMKVVKTSYINSIKDWVWPEKETASVFPNPVQRGASLNIKLDLKTGVEYNLDIINSSGKLITSRRIISTSKTKIENISITSMFASGTYFITISDKKKRIVHSGKVIVF